MDENEITLYTDGASRGNPGKASLGIYIETLGKEYSEYIGEATNNEAEYRALIEGLKKIKLLLGKAKAKQVSVQCYLDSELVVKQLNHKYKIQHETTQKYFLEVWNLMLDFSQVRFEHILREKNKKADALANLALDQNKQKTLL